eukprot:g5172.t1
MSIASQRQIRENALEAQDFLHDLDDWRNSVQSKDRELLSASKVKKHSLSTGDGTDSPMTESDLADELRNTGNVFFRDGNYTKAIEFYTQSIQKHRTCVCLANRAMAFLKMQSFPEAEVDCTEALKLDGTFLKAYQRRSVARKEQQKFRAALEDAEYAMRLDPVSLSITQSFQNLLKTAFVSEGVNSDQQWIRPIQNIQVIPTESIKRVLSHTNEVDGEVAVVTNKQEFKIPGVPKTWAEFESAYKLLKKQSSMLAQYLFQIPPVSLPSVFKSAMTAPVLCKILESVIKRVRLCESESKHWIGFLENLGRIQRFEMLLMCLTKDQKETLKKSWSELGAEQDIKLKIQSMLKF